MNDAAKDDIRAAIRALEARLDAAEAAGVSTAPTAATPLPTPVEPPPVVPMPHAYSAFGSQLGLLQDLIRNTQPKTESVIAFVVTPQDQIDMPPALVKNLPTIFLDRRVVFVPSAGAVPEGCEAVVVCRPSDTPMQYASALKKAKGPVIAVAKGDPLFDDFNLVGNIVGLRLARASQMQTFTVYALTYREPVRKAAAVPTPLPGTEANP